ncbi:unnamed protein product, partial [Rotaria sp. Silwood2]
EEAAYHQKQPQPMLQPVYIAPAVLVLGDNPIPYTCPNYQQQIVTRTEKKNDLLIWLAFGGFFILDLWCC